MKKRLKTEAFLAVLFALLCQVLEMFVFKNGTPNFVMNFLTVIALGLATAMCLSLAGCGVRAATVVEHKREGDAWKTIVKEELHDESSDNSGE